MVGGIKDLEVESDSESDEEDSIPSFTPAVTSAAATKNKGKGVFSMFRFAKFIVPPSLKIKIIIQFFRPTNVSRYLYLNYKWSSS